MSFTRSWVFSKIPLCIKQWVVQVHKSLDFISQCPSLIFNDLPIGCEMVWIFFAIGHGKWEVDGIEKLLKRMVWKEHIKSQGQSCRMWRKLSSSYNVRQTSTMLLIQMLTFWNVKLGEMDRSKTFDCGAICSSRKMHQLCSISHKDPTLLQCLLNTDSS